MRVACLAIGLSLWAGFWATQLMALEIEDRRVYPGTGPETLRILSTADLEVFDPYLRAFQARRPWVTLDYTVASSTQLHQAIRAGEPFDLAISSAMDLQFQMANDGLARDYASDRTAALPDWARWRDQVFAFTAEPAVVLLSAERFADLPLPRTRQDLITLLRDDPERFQGAVGTYDVRISGLGYLFATQEARSTDAFWRLSEVMGRLQPRLFCCSGQMIDDVAQGRLAMAYNVLGSYATDRLSQDSGGPVHILRMQDFANVMLRTALIPQAADDPANAGAFIDMLAELALREDPGEWPLPPLRQTAEDQPSDFGPIRLGPALMVYLDPLNRRAFLDEWENAMEQR